MSFPEIAHTARLLHSMYPMAAADLRRAEQVLNDTRTDGPAEHVPAALHTYRSIRDEVCEPLGRKLAELASVVPVLLPGTWKTLRLVGGVQHWHRKRIFDWEAGIAELRAIESAALSAGRDNRTGKPQAQRQRKRATKGWQPRQLTARQAEVVQLVGECKGNVAEAAKRLGRNRKTVVETYRVAMAKLGKDVVRSQAGQVFARDNRGQLDVSEIDDARRDRDADEDQEKQTRRYRRR